jgi:chromate transporter
MLYLQLFISFLKIGFFSFGGGYAMIPLITEEVVTVHHWVSMRELAQLIAISQMTPGPIAVSAATYIGYKTAGILGSILATTAVISPAFVIVMLMAKYFHVIKSNTFTQRMLAGIKPVVVFLIAVAGIKLAGSVVPGVASVLIGLGALLLLTKTKIHPIYTIIIGGLMGILIY